MNASGTTVSEPPKFQNALVSGFNLVANKAYLLLLPIALDLLLWFGPHFRLKTLLEPAFRDIYSLPAAGANDAAMLSSIRQLADFSLSHFNLLSLLSAVPVGVPSLMAGILPLANPLGEPLAIEVPSLGQAFSGWLLFAVLGLVTGSVYFGAVSRATASPPERFSLPSAVWQAGQVLFLTLILLILLFLLSIPIFVVTFLLALISPAIAQFSLLFSSFLLLWILIPLVFSPHGIFAASQNAFRSMMISLRLVRALFPGVGLFLLSAVILAQGMGVLWRLAPETSWLMLAGLFGNAFIGTSLLAASFIYYRGAASWASQFRK
jgi:hypothetical protein